MLLNIELSRDGVGGVTNTTVSKRTRNNNNNTRSLARVADIGDGSFVVLPARPGSELSRDLNKNVIDKTTPEVGTFLFVCFYTHTYIKRLQKYLLCRCAAL